MAIQHTFSTRSHIRNVVSKAKFLKLCEKTPKWRMSIDEHKWFDMSDCQFVGSGNHEIAVFTFERHIRNCKNQVIPIWIAAGPNWDNNWHDADGFPYADKPAISIVRSISDPAGLIEPLKMLAIISCQNAPSCFDGILKILQSRIYKGVAGAYKYANPHFRCFDATITEVVEAAKLILELPISMLEPISGRKTGACVSINFDELKAMAEAYVPFVYADCLVFGDGLDVVYAYAYDSSLNLAKNAFEIEYPVKIGYTKNNSADVTALQAASCRVASQIVFVEPVSLLCVLRCDNGKRLEAALHAHFKTSKIQAIGKEWFMTNAASVIDAISNIQCKSAP